MISAQRVTPCAGSQPIKETWVATAILLYSNTIDGAFGAFLPRYYAASIASVSRL